MAIESDAISRGLPWEAATSEVDWDALYAEQLPRVHDFIRYRIGPGPDVEDLTARVFEKAWTARRRYRRDLAAFGTWLIAIARNETIDHLRRRRPHVPLTEAEGVAAVETPESLAERRSDAARLAGLLADLPERERELIALKYGAGMTNRAIARLVRLSESNVGTLLHRTVAKLRAGWDAGPADSSAARSHT